MKLCLKSDQSEEGGVGLRIQALFQTSRDSRISTSLEAILRLICKCKQRGMGLIEPVLFICKMYSLPIQLYLLISFLGTFCTLVD